MEKDEDFDSDSTYNALHAGNDANEAHTDDGHYERDKHHKDSHSAPAAGSANESMDFEEVESVMWRKVKNY